MAKITVLVHRYDNAADIEAVQHNKCSEVFRKSPYKFNAVLVVPTNGAKSERAIIADPVSEQYQSDEKKEWPGKPAQYLWRVDLDNIRPTTLSKVKAAFTKVKEPWVGPWTVKVAVLDDSDL